MTGEYNSYGRQPSSTSFRAAYNDTHETRSSKRYINNDNPIPGDLLDNLVVDGFTHPVNIEFAPDGRIFVAEKGGVIKIVNADGTVQAQPWLDISPKVHNAADRGMLGMALDPNFAVNKWVYVLYVRNPQEGVPNINANIASIGKMIQQINQLDVNYHFKVLSLDTMIPLMEELMLVQNKFYLEMD